MKYIYKPFILAPDGMLDLSHPKAHFIEVWIDGKQTRGVQSIVRTKTGATYRVMSHVLDKDGDVVMEQGEDDQLTPILQVQAYRKNQLKLKERVTVRPKKS